MLFVLLMIKTKRIFHQESFASKYNVKRQPTNLESDSLSNQASPAAAALESSLADDKEMSVLSLDLGSMLSRDRGSARGSRWCGGR